MAENKRGVFSIVSLPIVYNTVQFVAGAAMYRENMVRDFIKPFDGCRIMDIGCGTGEYVHHVRRHCRTFEYYGFDGEAVYIEHARRIFADSPSVHFAHRVLTAEDVDQFGGMDIVIATGVMHHMDDPLVLSLLRLAKLALKPGGRLITYDPGRYEKMSLLENFFYKYDRGRSIRYEHEYASLIRQVFPDFQSHERYLTYYKSRNIVFECRA